MMIQEQLNAISAYVPCLSFGKGNAHFVEEKFVRPKISRFFKVRKIEKYEPLDVAKCISDLDFKKVEFSYFYNYILSNIKKKDKIQNVVKYSITFDEEVTTLFCEETKLKYDEILLNKEPIFYFVYFDLKEIMSFIRTSIN